MRYSELPPLALVKRRLHYDPVNGQWTFLVARGRRRAGEAVVPNPKFAYLHIRIDGISYGSSRLAWLYMTGEDPKELMVDHKDGDPLNDAWSNLRLADQTQQNQNQRVRKDSHTGHRCINRSRAKRWIVRAVVEGKRKSISRHETLDEAIASRDSALKELHGAFYREQQ